MTPMSIRSHSVASGERQGVSSFTALSQARKEDYSSGGRGRFHTALDTRSLDFPPLILSVSHLIADDCESSEFYL